MSEKVTISTPVTVGDLAEAIGAEASEVVGELMKNGVMATINDTLDFETAAIVAEDLGVEIEESAEEPADQGEDQTLTVLEPGEGEPRPPVVAVMGHVDHGKTTLLDALRGSSIASGEAGGITQHISAYQLEHNGRKATFLDTPGHEAFSMLRQHGADLTDVVILVVAADDGVKPQTEEVIKFARNAGVRLIVAVNKIDKPDVDPNRVRQQLSESGIIPEEWGGETVVVDISAQKQQNLDKLLDMVMLVADMEDLRSRSEGPMEGTVIEAQQVKGKGAVATILVQHGELNTGDFLVAGEVYGKVRSLEDFAGQRIEKAEVSMPVAVSGWKNPPKQGSFVYEVEDEKEARAKASGSESGQDTTSSITRPEDLGAAIQAGKAKTLPVLVKADVDGSLNAIVDSIESLETEEVRPEVIGKSIGPVTESDINLAESAQAAIVGFNISINNRNKQLATRAGVDIRLYTVIYELLDDLRAGLSELLDPEVIEDQKAALLVKGVFKTAQKELICGGQVTSGKLTPGLKVRIQSEDEEEETSEEIGEVTALQREQQQAKEIKEGELCGVSIATKQKVKLNEGDRLQFFTRTTKKRSI